MFVARIIVIVFFDRTHTVTTYQYTLRNVVTARKLRLRQIKARQSLLTAAVVDWHVRHSIHLHAIDSVSTPLRSLWCKDSDFGTSQNTQTDEGVWCLSGGFAHALCCKSDQS